MRRNYYFDDSIYSRKKSKSPKKRKKFWRRLFKFSVKVLVPMFALIPPGIHAWAYYKDATKDDRKAARLYKELRKKRKNNRGGR